MAHRCLHVLALSEAHVRYTLALSISRSNPVSASPAAIAASAAISTGVFAAAGMFAAPAPPPAASLPALLILPMLLLLLLPCLWRQQHGRAEVVHPPTEEIDVVNSMQMYRL